MNNGSCVTQRVNQCWSIISQSKPSVMKTNHLVVQFLLNFIQVHTDFILGCLHFHNISFSWKSIVIIDFYRQIQLALVIIDFYRQIQLVNRQLSTNIEYYRLIDYVFDDRLWSTCYVLLKEYAFKSTLPHLPIRIIHYPIWEQVMLSSVFTRQLLKQEKSKSNMEQVSAKFKTL